jgi:hypothetical protein
MLLFARRILTVFVSEHQKKILKKLFTALDFSHLRLRSPRYALSASILLAAPKWSDHAGGLATPKLLSEGGERRVFMGKFTGSPASGKNMLAQHIFFAEKPM